ncbi:substrate-binding domain-containing protein [Dactylosporangium salmoneum]|uniref:Substrate-binding domain-containing protein n=1 Tax=Dactylosporangium salmoneum TaxID=53361 RepID=A0ABP5SGN5_9ACTN
MDVPNRGRSLRIPIAIGAVVVLGAAGVVTVRAVSGGGSCSGGVRLTVAAAPEIAPAVRDAAARFTAKGPEVRGNCIRVEVRAAESADVAALLAARNGGTVIPGASAGPSPADADVPTVWIPDSTAWLTRVRAVNREAFEAQVTSVAASPVVLAATEKVAAGLGGHAIGAEQVNTLLSKVAARQLQVGAVDPRRSTAGLAGAGLLYDSIAADPKRLVDMVRVYRSIALSENPPALLRAAATGAQAVLTSEQQVLSLSSPTATSRKSDFSSDPAIDGDLSGLVTMPLDPSMTLDYPYAVVSGKPASNLAAAELLRSALTAARDPFTRLGFRGPDGSTGAAFPTGHGVSQAEALVKPLSDAEKITEVLGYWNATTAPSRVLTLMDVTSSMTRPIAKGGPSRLDVLRKAATDGLGLFTDDSELGLWAYAAGLPGGKDYQQIVPVSALTKGQRARLTSAVAAAKAAPTDTCGLYETVLAAYRSLKEGYKDGRSNTVVVFTDGANSKPGMSLETLQLELERATDPTRPVRVVLLGIGPDVNKQELDTIAATTGGRAFVVQDPEQIGNIFLQALIRSS